MSNIMLRQVRLFLNVNLYSPKRCVDLGRQTLSTSLRTVSSWDLISSICLERSPVLSRELNSLEQRFQALQSTVEFESSLKSDHEVRKEQEQNLAERIKKGQIDESEIEQTTMTTAQDFEDASQDELTNFKLAPRTTDDSKKSSIDRKLDKHLLLLVKQKFGDKAIWVLPQEKRAEGETMRQAAERALKTSCGDNLNAVFLGNAPWGFYKYKYPSAVRKSGGPEGAKIFFFKAMYQSGNIKSKDIQWLTKDEAAACLPEEYFKSVDQFLLHEPCEQEKSAK
ncbi:hypothetical protein B566_EDAN010101 [Ephemera danica]|nr:hypothetical protein B566_EDAN010101 [Ephemera danica]